MNVSMRKLEEKKRKIGSVCVRVFFLVGCNGYCEQGLSGSVADIVFAAPVHMVNIRTFLVCVVLGNASEKCFLFLEKMEIIPRGAFSSRTNSR